MTQTSEILKQDEGGILAQADIQDIEGRFALAVKQRGLLEEYIRNHLTGNHYYIVAGSDRRSLNKGGAELICLGHGYKPRYDIIGGPEEPMEDDRPYQITVKCTLYDSRQDQGEGLGSASSHTTKRDGSRVYRQKDPGLRHNSTLKMAQKSAYICATIASTAASEFFTQDMEDIAMTEGPEADPTSHQATPAHSPASQLVTVHLYTGEGNVCSDHKVLWQHVRGTRDNGETYDFWACPEKTVRLDKDRKPMLRSDGHPQKDFCKAPKQDDAPQQPRGAVETTRRPDVSAPAPSAGSQRDPDLPPPLAEEVGA